MFYIESLKQLVERARDSFWAYLPGSDARIWPNNINPTAKVIAGFAHEVFGFADYIAKQKFALTADTENLDLHAEELGLARRPAAPANGSITVTTTGDFYAPAGTTFTRLDGFVYLATADASRTGAGTLDVAVIASLDGTAGNAIAGTSVSIGGTAIGDGLAVVGAGGLVPGADVEQDGPPFTGDLSTLRGRVLFRKKYPPHGGNAADYVQWATEISGVTRVFVERLWSGPGTVRVFPLMDNLYPADGVPGAADVARVNEHIDAMRPSGAVVTVVAPTRKVINITITALTPDTPATREAALAELRDTFRRLSVVSGNDAGNSSMPFLATPQSFSRSWIWQAIANATGEQRHILTAPAADVALAAGEYPVLGAVTFA